MELGYIPSKPIFDARYDLILDDHKKLTKVQIKYANGIPTHIAGSVIVSLDYENRKRESFTYLKHEVDALIIYIPKIDKLCFLPPKLFLGKKKLSIRLEMPKNGQKDRIIYAKDYYW